MTTHSVGAPSPLSVKKREFDFTIVGIGEKVVCDRPQSRIITFSLGSCVGVVLYDRVRRAAGMIHCLLPVATEFDGHDRRSPDLFVSTGLTGLIQLMFKSGSERSNLIAYVAGAASVLHDKRGHFRIGERNLAVARKVLEKNAIEVVGESTGATHARTMFVDVATGDTFVRIGREETKL